MSELKIKVENIGQVSDGFHTFDELYEHRCILFINLCLLKYESAVWREDEETDDWFLLYLELPAGQVSYHIPNKLKHLIVKLIPKVKSYEWDGHTSPDVVKRLEKFAKDLY